MCFWNGKFVLRSIEISEEERNSDCYHVYCHAKKADDLTSDNNYFDSEPFLASMKVYVAVPLDQPRQWPVQLALNPPVWVPMGVFQLQVRS